MEKDVHQKKIEAVGKVCKLAEEDQKYTEGQKKKEKKVISLILDVALNCFHEELL